MRVLVIGNEWADLPALPHYFKWGQQVDLLDFEQAVLIYLFEVKKFLVREQL